MKRPTPFLLAALAGALVLAGCMSDAQTRREAPAAGAQSTGLAAQDARITDSVILRDQKTLDSVQLRLRRLSEAGIAQNNYSLAKAQCWLDTAKSQYEENDRTGYIEESLAESVKIIQALEADRNARAGYDTPLVANSTRLRDDLWAQLTGFKGRTATLACNARTVACAEVRLVRAGHAEQQTGWRQATPHVQMAEDAIRRAGIEAAACAAPVIATAPSAPAPTVTVTVTRERFVILADTLFKFNRSAREDMLPGGLQTLQAVAERLKGYQTVQSITIAGHTDRLGSEAYNDKLSQARADTVKAYFESLGTKAAITAKGMGEREPVTTSCSDKLPRARLIQCLQPDRRVTIEIAGAAAR